MTKPTQQDALMLLKVMEVFMSEPVREARQFWRTIPDGLGFEELQEKYPKGSKEFEQIGNMMIFWETIGSLIKRGLLNEELAFDTFLDAPPWKKMERYFKERREKENAPLEGENLEIAYKRSIEWMKRRSKSSRKTKLG